MKRVLLALAVLAGCRPPEAPPPKPVPPPPVGSAAGQSAPAFSLVDSKGAPYAEAAFVGRKAQLLVIGTTACPLCQARMADIESIHQKRGAAVEVAAMLLSETAEKAEKFAADSGATFRMVLDPQNTTMVLYKPGHYPHFVLIDKQGIIRYSGHDLPKEALLDDACR